MRVLPKEWHVSDSTSLFLPPLSAITLGTLTLPAPAFAGTCSPATAVYVVVAGDFLAGIAAKLGVSLPQLLTANNLTTKSVILPGDKLIVPPGGTVPATAPAAVGACAGSLVHTVKSGEFLARNCQPAQGHAGRSADRQQAHRQEPDPARADNLALPANAVAAPNAAGTSAPSAPAVGALTYTVKSGDFLAGIAAAYKVSLPDLLAVNKLTASSLILPGAKLALPAGAVQPVALPRQPPTSPAASPGRSGTVVAFAYAQLGKPYRFFTAGPDTFDCSGLTMAAYAQIGIQLIHHSASQATMGTAVDIWNEPIKAGDLIFMATHGDPNVITHVGIAVDATHWIHAPKPGDVVRLAPIPPKGILNVRAALVP